MTDPSEFGGTNELTKMNHSDTTILLHISADRKSAYGVSIPRDSMVRRPDCKDPTKVPLAQAPIGMFNAAYNDGGIGCTVMTVEANTGVRVDHYAVVNFEGFRDMVDALGGVDICLPQAVDDPTTGLKLPAGVTHLDGHQAAQFVRARKGIGDGSDIGRIGRQQAFLSALVREATDSKLLLRPDKLYSFLDAATTSVTMDPDMAGIRNLSELALQMKKMKPDAVQFITVPTETYPADHNRVQWTAAAKDIWAAARIDSPLPGQPGSRVGASSVETAKPTVSPTRLTVTVYNATETPGLAKQVAAVLTAQGFNVTGSQPSTAGSVQGVEIKYPKGQDEAVATLAAAFPGATLTPIAEVTDYEVSIGPGAGDVHEVPNRVGGDPLPPQPADAARHPAQERHQGPWVGEQLGREGTETDAVPEHLTAVLGVVGPVDVPDDGGGFIGDRAAGPYHPEEVVEIFAAGCAGRRRAARRSHRSPGSVRATSPRRHWPP